MKQDIDILMENVANRLETVGGADDHTPQAEIDRLETLYLRLYQSKSGHGSRAEDAEPFDGHLSHRHRHRPHHGTGHDQSVPPTR